MRLFPRNNGKDDARLLARTQLVHHLRLHRASAAIPAQETSNLLNTFSWHEHLLEVIQGRVTQV